MRSRLANSASIVLLLAILSSCATPTSPSSGGSNTNVTGAGTWDTRFGSSASAPNNTVRNVVIIGTKVYISGSFDSVAGKRIVGLAVWDGSTWSTVGAGLMNGSSIEEIATDGTDLFVAGNFTPSSGGPALTFAKWNGSTWSQIGPAGTFVSEFAVDGSDIYMMNGSVSKLQSNQWVALPAPPAGGNSRILAASGGRVFVGYSGMDLDNGVFEFKNGAWTALGPAFVDDPNKGFGSAYVNIYYILATGSSVYVAGNFSDIGGVTLPNFGLAKWDGSQWVGIGGKPPTVGTGGKLALDESGNLYVGRAGSLDKWDGTNWSLICYTSGLGQRGASSAIDDYAVGHGMVAIGGEFVQVNTTSSYKFGLLH